MLVELQGLAHAVQELERAAGVIPDLETRVDEHVGQPVHGALRARIGQNARDAAPDGEVLVRIEQRVHQLTDGAVCVQEKKGARPVEGLVPGQQPDRLRHQQRIERQVRRKRGGHPSGHAGPQFGQPRKHRVLRERSRRGRDCRGGGSRSWPGGGPSRVQRSVGTRPVNGTHDGGERGGILNLGFVDCYRAAQQAVFKNGDVRGVHAAGDPSADDGEPDAPPAGSGVTACRGPRNSSR